MSKIRISTIPALLLATTLFAALAAADSASTEPAPITPLASARVGDWADYDMLQGRQALRVTHITLLLADVEVRSYLSAKPVGLPAIRSLKQDSDWALDFAASDGAEVKSAHDTIDVAGRRLNCRYTIATWKLGPATCERRVWMHPDIPIYGVARMELRVDGKLTARMNLTGFGRGPEDPAPASQPTSAPTSQTDKK